MAFGDFARLDDYNPDAGFVDTFRERFGAAPLSAEEAAAMRQRQFRNRPPEASAETIDKLAGVASDALIPKTPLDVGLTLATLPAGPLARPAARVGALALGALFEPGEAQGGVLSKIAKGIRAYHGSPHDFDRFDLSKIGTGEGAQAYGHGLYFAEAEQVAKGYRERLSSNMGNLHRPGGRMYEVSLNARPEQFLDWDRPLSGQAAQNVVPEILKEMPKAGWMPTLKNDLTAARRGIAGNPEMTGADVYGALKNLSSPDTATAALREAGIPGIRYLDQGSRPHLAGYEAELQKYKGLVEESRNRLKADPNNQTLRDELIKTRNELNRIERVGPGTSNYAVWMPEIITIMRKYGLAGLTAAPAAMGALADQSGYRKD